MLRKRYRGALSATLRKNNLDDALLSILSSATTCIIKDGFTGNEEEDKALVEDIMAWGDRYAAKRGVTNWHGFNKREE